MAVYTTLSTDQVGAFIADFGFPVLEQLQATSAGIENTNYFVTACDRAGISQRLVLTLFERMTAAELPYFVELTSYLASAGLPVPAPCRNQQGQALLTLANRPALLVPCFPGQHPATPNLAQCRAIAEAMARMHLASPGFSQRRSNDRGEMWRQMALQRLQPFLDATQKQLMRDQVSAWRLQLPQIDQLPAGINHHDLFHDNALFDGDRLTGIIDFYNACDDVFIYDLAVLVNDWCSDGSGQLVQDRYQAVLEAYQALRPLTAPEQALWPQMLGYAALRFWISRLLSWHSPDASGNTRGKTSHTVSQKDPRPMQQLLEQRLAALKP